MKDTTREELKKLLISFSELNMAISSILDSGGNMSVEQKTEETVTEAAAAEETKVEGAASAEAGAEVAAAEVTAPEAKTEAAETTEAKDKKACAKCGKEKANMDQELCSDCMEKEQASVAEPVVETAVAEKTEEADAAVVRSETVVIEKATVVDGEAGVYATQTNTTETVVEQVVETAETAEASIDPFSTPITAEAATKLGLAETEASLVVGKSFIDVVKVMASLTQEVAQYRAEAKAAEFSRVTEARVSELKELGMTLDLSEGSADRERIAGMGDEAFAAYRDGIRDLSKTVAAGKSVETSTKTIETAKASVAAISKTTNVPVTKESRKSKFAKL